jgi:hypothetical protein
MIDLFRFLSKKGWKHNEYFLKDWEGRISFMANMIGSANSVLDLGCGPCWLRNYLKPGIAYYGCDYVQRFPETLVADFNKYEFPDIYVDVCFASGVLEYVSDVPWFISQCAKHCNMLIISYSSLDYCCHNLKQRKKLNWVNHYTEADVLNICFKNNLTLNNRSYYDKQSIFILKKSSG